MSGANFPPIFAGKCKPRLGSSASKDQTLVLAGLAFSPSSDELERSSSPGVNIHRTRSFPGADIGSDHDLVMMVFQVRLKMTRKPNQPRLRLNDWLNTII